MNKPKFDPNKPFEPAPEASAKPPFNPDRPYEPLPDNSVDEYGDFLNSGSIDADVSRLSKKYNIPENELWKKATMRGMTSDKAGAGEDTLVKTMGVLDGAAFNAPSWIAKKLEDDNGEAAIDELYDVIKLKKSGVQQVAEFAGGVAAPAINVFKTTTKAAPFIKKFGVGIANGAAMGGAAGVANSHDGEEIGGAIDGAELGAAIGAGAQVVGRGLQSAPKYGHILAEAGRGAVEGMKEGQTIGAIFRGAQKGRDAYKMITGLETAIAKDKAAGLDWGMPADIPPSEIPVQAPKNPSSEMAPISVSPASEIPAQAPKKPAKAAKPRGEEIDFRDIIATAGAHEGPSHVKTWIAQNAYIGRPSAGKSETYNEALVMGPNRRIKAKDFDPRVAADELAPDIMKFKGALVEGRNKAFNELQNKAAPHYQPGNIDEQVLEVALEAQKLAGNKLITGTAHNLIHNAYRVMQEGAEMSPNSWGLKGGGYNDISDAEKFHRLQKSRELLDTEIKNVTAGGKPPNLSQRMMMRMRDVIDDSLKTAPGKIEADELYSRGKDVENRIFNKLSFDGRPLDVGKLSRVMGKNESADRFKLAMQETRAYYDKFGSKIGNVEIANKTLDAMEAMQGIAADKRLLEKLRFEDGPSSASVKLLGYMMDKFSLDLMAIQNPYGYLNMMDESIKAFGNEVGAVPVWLKKIRMNMQVWAKHNPNATPEQMRAAAKGMGLPEQLIK